MPDRKPAPKRVAALVTVYHRWSHADVIIGKILEGYNYDGKEGPNMRVVSMYVDQKTDRDMSQDLAKKYNFTIYNNIPDCVTLGQKGVNVDGILCIGEHGKYERNKVGQLLYPRRRFFEESTNVLARHKRSVPVFNDKHLGPVWSDARWMYDRARELHLPFMAGSSIPVTWRKPELRLPMKVELVEAVQIGYGPLEGYSFHALEGMQCLVERRRGGETGVRSVQHLNGEEMWKAMDNKLFSRELLEAAMTRVPSHAKGDYRKLTARDKEAAVYLIEYRDGFKAAVAMMNGWTYEGDGGAFTFACRARGQDKILSTHFYMQQPDPFAHFAYQVRAIDRMMQTGHPAYPVERTLLTSGILDAALNSRADNNRRIETKHLDIRYQPTDWGFATDPVPKAIKR